MNDDYYADEVTNNIMKKRRMTLTKANHNYFGKKKRVEFYLLIFKNMEI